MRLLVGERHKENELQGIRLLQEEGAPHKDWVGRRGKEKVHHREQHHKEHRVVVVVHRKERGQRHREKEQHHRGKERRRERLHRHRGVGQHVHRGYGVQRHAYQAYWAYREYEAYGGSPCRLLQGQLRWEQGRGWL